MPSSEMIIPSIAHFSLGKKDMYGVSFFFTNIRGIYDIHDDIT